jgi:hypothetical protein
MTNVVHVIQKGDTRTPLGAVLYQGGKPVDLSSLTVKVLGKKNDGTAWIATAVGTQTGITAHPTTTFTADATTDRITANGHKAKNGMEVLLTNQGGALPAGLAASTRYIVKAADANSFALSLVTNGADVDITGAGTGTHSFAIVGSVQYDFQTADVAAAGTYWLWFKVYDGSSEIDTFPVIRRSDNRGLNVEIVDNA